MSMLLAAAEPVKAVLVLIDIVFVAILLLFLGIGIKKGMMKMGFHLLAGIASIALAVFTAMPVTNAIADNTKWDDQLGSKLETSIIKQVPNPYAEVKFYNNGESEDALGYEVALEDGTLEMRPFETILDGSGFFSLINLQKVLDPVFREALEKEAARLEADTAEGEVAPEASVVFIVETELYFAKLIIVAIAFLVLCIAYRIVLAIIGYVLDKAVRKLYIAHFVNKLLGAVFGFACGAVLLIVVLTVLQLLGSFPFMEEVTAYLNGTKLVSFIMDKNIIYQWLAGFFGMNG